MLTPALCATLLKPVAKGAHAHGRRGFFGWFNRGYERANRGYVRSLGNVLTHNKRYLAVYAALVVYASLYASAEWRDQGIGA